jgi:hypothetical protein
MGSLKDMPVSHIQDFQNMFNEHFKQPTPKKATGKEVKQEGRPKGKKRRDDE